LKFDIQQFQHAASSLLALLHRGLFSKTILPPTKLNVLADAFSRLPRFSDAEGMEGKNVATSETPKPLYMMQFVELYECLRDLPEMDNYFAVSDHMLNLPASGPNPVVFEWL
jgi:hypothetical protein